MAGYRDTLNLPRTSFPMKADLARQEPERLRWWDERGVVAELRAQRRGRPVSLLHDGPPYSNAHLHVGTAANKIWKDAVVRSQTLFGFDSPYVPGWDNHGMPIESQVSREFRERGETPDRLALRRRCREYAAEWVAIQRDEFRRLGVWGEWDHPYLTMDHAFEAEILETFAALVERGFVQRGLRSIHWCPTDRTALAEAEIEYQDDPSPSIHVLFPLREDSRGALAGIETTSGPVAAVAWTTTPWTLPANLGLMVDPDAEYVVVEARGPKGAHTVLVAAARLESLRELAGWTDVRRLASRRGRDLLDVVFTGPWDRPSRVVDGTPFVSLSEGTGLVHTAPGHGKEDFAVGARENLGVFTPVDDAGRLGEGAEPFVGRSVLDVNEDIIAWLDTRGRLLASRPITHSYPHCWRCRKPVIFRATEQWFMMIDHDGHRERALGVIEERVRWEPESSRNRIREAVRTRPDWCLSRQRSWGVGIPAVYCSTCQAPTLSVPLIHKVAAETRTRGSDAWFELPVETFLPEGFRCSGCGGEGPFEKETDILDVWFDSGSTHRAVQVTHPELAERWARARHGGGRVIYFEGPDQHRGWFNSSLMVGVGVQREAPYTDVLTHGWVLDAEGKAMHKSLGNVTSPDQVIVRYGADVLRWWALATDWRSDVRIGAEILQRVGEAYRKVRNTFRFLLGNLDGFTPDMALPPSGMTVLDRVVDAHLAGRVARMRADYEGFAFHRVLDQLLDVCTVDLSSVYLDVSKDRLYTLAPDARERRSAQTVLWHALHDLCVAASPILPFTAEEVWQSHPALTAESGSVHLAPWPERQVGRPFEHAGDDEWSFLLAVRDAVNAAIEPLRATKQLATTLEAEVVLTGPTEAIARLAHYRDELVGFLMVARAEAVERVDVMELDVDVTPTRATRCDRCWTHRPDVRPVEAGGSLCGRCVSVLAVPR